MYIFKKVIGIIALFLIFILLYSGKIFSQETKTENLQSIVLEDFSLGQDNKPKRMWVAEPNRFGRKDNLESGESLQQVSWINAWPEAYFGKEGKISINGEVIENKTCLGVKLAFNRQGYNYVELYPLEFKDGKYVKTTLPFTGIVKQIDLWVWGANYNYTMEMVLKDYKGVEYRLPIGSIQHIGWKNFTVEIPNWIPQTGPYALSQYGFSLEKLVIWTTPEEKVDGTYVYISYIKYLTDIFKNYYDGSELGNKNNIDDLWGKAPKGPSDKDIKN